MIKIAIFGMNPDGTPDLNTRHWLAGHPLLSNSKHSAVDKDARSPARKSQDVVGNAWPFALPEDRGNETLKMSFSTTLTFTSAVEAWRWRNNFSSQNPANWPHPISGDALMRFELPDGTFEDVRLYNVLISKPQMDGNGVSMELSYTLTGGRIENLTSGRLVIPVGNQSLDTPAQMLFFGNKTGGGFTDDASPTVDLLGPTMLTTYELVINVYEDGINSIYEAKFYVRPSGGGSLSGYTSIDGPVTASWPAVIAALDPDFITGEAVVSGGRSALKLSAVMMGDGGAASRIRLRVLDASAYDGDKFGGFMDTPVIPVDANGDIPVSEMAI